MSNADNGMFVNDQVINMALPAGTQALSTMGKGTEKHEKIKLASTVSDRYTGLYLQSNGKKMYVTREGECLKISGDGLPTGIVFPESNTRFFLPGYYVQLEFLPPAAGHSMTLAVFEGGKQIMKTDRQDR